MPRLLPLLITALLTAPALRTSALEPLDAPALHTTLRDLIDTHPTAKRTHVALKVTDLETGEVLFDQNSDKLFTPASNLKIYTSAAALALLGPEHRWTTRIVTSDTKDDGILKRIISIESDGDPMFDTAQLSQLADELLKHPDAKQIDASVSVATRDEWSDVPLKGPGWMWDDDPDYYNMSIQSVMLNFNVADFVAKSGSDGPVITNRPPTYLLVDGTVHGRGPSSGQEYRLNAWSDKSQSETEKFAIDRNPFDPQFFLRGKLPSDSGPVEFALTVHDPKHWIGHVFLQMLIDREANFGNKPLYSDPLMSFPAYGGGYARSRSEERILVEQRGKTNAEAVKHFLKVSENAVGEMLLLTLSEKFGEGEQVSWPSGAKVISDWLVNTAGLEDGSFRLVDGSGLSRYNLISADSSIRLLAYMKNDSEHFEPFFDGLPIYKVTLPEGGQWGGVPVAEFDSERVFAKPGGMSGVSTISGYVQTLDGRWLAFSLLGNGYIGSSAPVRDLRNQVWAELVRYQPAAVAVPADGVSP